MSDDSRFEDYSDKEIQDMNKKVIVENYEEEHVPPCKPLAQSGHSLEADMLFGWRPKALDLDGPVILSFGPELFTPQVPIFYGFRPEDSFELHETISKLSGYRFKINPAVKHSYSILRKELPKSMKRPFVGMSSSDLDIEFDSLFESGNLDKVIRLRENEFDLYIRPDTNTRGHNQWYYFLVKNKSNARSVKFNILNFTKRDSLYSQGFLPYIYSSKSSKWKQSGHSASYSLSKLTNEYRSYYTLTFTYNFSANEEIYVSHSIPYTYTDLTLFLDSLNSEHCTRSSLGKTLSGIETPLLSITDLKCPGPKETVIITSRVHPGESHGSWVMQGLVLYLLSPSASALRSKLIFKVIPMLNPDGVISGNSRCNLVGDDLNRQFNSPDERLHPTIFAIKQLTREAYKLLLYLDIHSHSQKKGCFFYAPHFPLHSDKYYPVRILPKLFSEITDMFRYHSCKYRNEWAKRNTARLALSRQFNLTFSYTMECSCHGYFNAQRETVIYSERNLQKLGGFVGDTIHQYLEARSEQRRVKAAKKANKSNKRKRIKIRPQKRTLDDVIKDIKEECKDSDSDHGGSESSSEEENEEAANERKIIRMKVISLLDQVLGMVQPFRHKSNQKSQEFSAKSKLAKYFSKSNRLYVRTGSVPKRIMNNSHRTHEKIPKINQKRAVSKIFKK